MKKTGIFLFIVLSPLVISTSFSDTVKFPELKRYHIVDFNNVPSKECAFMADSTRLSGDIQRKIINENVTDYVHKGTYKVNKANNLMTEFSVDMVVHVEKLHGVFVYKTEGTLIANKNNQKVTYPYFGFGTQLDSNQSYHGVYSIGNLCKGETISQ